MNFFKDFPFIEQDTNARSLSFNCKGEITCIDARVLDELRRIVCETGLNARISVHPSAEADLHNMIICQRYRNYVRPHLHTTKSETLHLIDGELSVFIFDEEGHVIKRCDMSSAGVFLFRTSLNCYHTYVPTTDYVIYHESKRGPFTREGDSIFASWSIVESDTAQVRRFIEGLLTMNGQI